MNFCKLFAYIGFATSVATAQVAMNAVANFEADEDEVYYMDRDPSALTKQNLVDALEANLWGTALGSEEWNLDLSSPLHDGSRFAVGQNRMGLPFDIEFESLYLSDDGSQGVWSGKLSAMGDFYCYGIYFAQNGFATLIPIYSRVDQNELASLFATPQHRYECELDLIGTWQMNQNIAMEVECINNHEVATYAAIGFCTGSGVATCWLSAGVGCAWGFGCLTGVTVNEYFWKKAYTNQTTTVNACICNDVMFRHNNPSYPQNNTTSDCSKFKCPGTLIPIR